MDRAVIVCQRYAGPCGGLVLGSVDGGLCLCDWDRPERPALTERRLGMEFVFEECETNRRAAAQLDEYFSGRRRDFDLPLVLIGTEFRRKVWNELRSIGYGETVSYSDVALRIGRASSVRAVASAIGANPLSIFIPCHRVTGKSGALTGYAGGVEAKRFLLDLE